MGNEVSGAVSHDEDMADGGWPEPVSLTCCASEAGRAEKAGGLRVGNT